MSEANGWDVTAPIHHIASDKHKTKWTKDFERLFKSGGLTLESEYNKIPLPGHNGSHIEEYHKEVFKALDEAILGKKTEAERRQAIIEALLKLKERLLLNPRLPYSNGGL